MASVSTFHYPLMIAFYIPAPEQMLLLNIFQAFTKNAKKPHHRAYQDFLGLLFFQILYQLHQNINGC